MEYLHSGLLKNDNVRAARQDGRCQAQVSNQLIARRWAEFEDSLAIDVELFELTGQCVTAPT